MLAHIVVGKGFLVGIVEALETRVRQVFLILAPRDAPGIQQIHHG